MWGLLLQWQYHLLGVLQNLSVMTEMIEIVETEGQIVGGQMCPKIIDRFLTGQAKGTPLANPWKTGLED